jgi:replicative DNA helicase
MAVFFRNIFGFSFIVVSQFNRGIEGMDRKANDAQEPQLSDFKETGSTQEDANLVLGLFNPFRYGLDMHRGYPISKLQRRYRSVHVLKNRGGKDGLAIGMHFMGETGKFKELPTAQQIEENPRLLEKILKYGN